MNLLGLLTKRSAAVSSSTSRSAATTSDRCGWSSTQPRSTIFSQLLLAFVRRCGVKAVLLASLAFVSSIHAQYAINKFAIAGGGGLNSTGGVYAVSGTIGQADASGPLSGGTYTLVGGFWALPSAVQTTNGPILTIAPAAPGSATISWTPATPGFVLQESPSLAPVAWSNSPSGVTNPIVVPAGLPVKFYRLFKP